MFNNFGANLFPLDSQISGGTSEDNELTEKEVIVKEKPEEEPEEPKEPEQGRSSGRRRCGGLASSSAGDDCSGRRRSATSCPSGGLLDRSSRAKSLVI